MTLRYLRTDIFLALAFLTQIVFWYHTYSIKPDMSIVPRVPGEKAVKALAFGDEQFYFRVLAFRIQNAGDTFGRFTPLKDYDYPKLLAWFRLLDKLDHKSNLIPTLASYYFSLSQNKEDVVYLIDYLEEHAERDMHRKWWWMYQATYLANYKLQDKERALELAQKLAKTPNERAPIWVRQMPAFILADMNEDQEALVIIDNLLKNSDNLNEGEKNYMYYFIEERLKRIEEKHGR